MKRSTAIRTARKIHDRVRNLAGVICTPYANREALRVRRLWVFGSTAKGSQNPNDIDVLVDAYMCGRWRQYGREKYSEYSILGARVDKRRLRAMGVFLAIDARDEALRTIGKNLKMVRFHRLEIDGNFGDISQTKIMIYPRFELKD